MMNFMSHYMAGTHIKQLIMNSFSLVFWSGGGCDAREYIFTKHELDSMTKIHGVNPNPPRFFETVELKH